MSEQPRRYVLAEGYPWFFGVGPEYHVLQMETKPIKSDYVAFKVPASLLKADVPKMRLVLEVLKGGRA